MHTCDEHSKPFHTYGLGPYSGFHGKLKTWQESRSLELSVGVVKHDSLDGFIQNSEGLKEPRCHHIL